MKHPNKKRVPSSLANRNNSGRLIKIKAHAPYIEDSSITCVGATYQAWFKTNSAGDELPKVYHAIEINGKGYNVDNSEDIIGKTFQDANETVMVTLNSTGEGFVSLSAQGLVGGELARVKLTTPTSPEPTGSGLETTVTGPNTVPNNPTITVDEEANVVTVCLVCAGPT